ncbi:hypothetical protein GOBAR_DD06230 [Gossypium barbadense]|nr:hypothetical protein GOBAR_DD06230 [Gossypium barbadense]
MSCCGGAEEELDGPPTNQYQTPPRAGSQIGGPGSGRGRGEPRGGGAAKSGDPQKVCSVYILRLSNILIGSGGIVLYQLAAVAALCVQYEADFRPNMTIVVKALQPLLNAKPAGPEPPS